MVILNETNAEKCKAKISINQNEEADSILNKYLLHVDTTGFYSDQLVNENELDVGCLLDIEYTNNSGMEQNLCYKLRAKVMIKFTQVAHLTLKNLQDIE